MEDRPRLQSRPGDYDDYYDYYDYDDDYGNNFGEDFDDYDEVEGHPPPQSQLGHQSFDPMTSCVWDDLLISRITFLGTYRGTGLSCWAQ